MDKKEPLLSICIPTYNREKYLKRLLDSIVCQKEFIDTDDVEIVVDDGPSSDNTETMVKEYIKKYGHKIKYYRNPVRIWMCPAFLEALNFWNWKYLKLMWSDDMFSDNAIWIFLNTIKLCNSKLILCNRDWVDKKNTMNKKNITDELEILNFQWFSDFSTYIWYKDNDVYHKDTYFSFISVFCINKDYFHNSYKFLKRIMSEDYIKHQYFNFTLIWYSNLRNDDIITVIKKPHLVYYWSDNTTSWVLSLRIVKDLYSEFKFLWNTYPVSKNWKRIMKKIVFRWLVRLYLPYIKKIFSLPWLKSIYKILAKKHIKDMWYE